MKYLVLVIQLKKQTNTKVTEIENKLTDHNHDKYIDLKSLINQLEMFLMQDQHKKI